MIHATYYARIFDKTCKLEYNEICLYINTFSSTVVVEKESTDNNIIDNELILVISLISYFINNISCSFTIH